MRGAIVCQLQLGEYREMKFEPCPVCLGMKNNADRESLVTISESGSEYTTDTGSECTETSAGSMEGAMRSMEETQADHTGAGNVNSSQNNRDINGNVKTQNTANLSTQKMARIWGKKTVDVNSNTSKSSQRNGITRHLDGISEVSSTSTYKMRLADDIQYWKTELTPDVLLINELNATSEGGNLI